MQNSFEADRKSLLTMLELYDSTWGQLLTPGLDAEDQRGEGEKLRQFVKTDDLFCERNHWKGHLTGSGLPVSPDLKEVLLTLHAKLNVWLQLGGHADGSPRAHEVAMREVEEESGLTEVSFLSYEKFFEGRSPPFPLMFDVDIHSIPARKNDPAHLHYDVRYLMVVQKPQRLVISDESTDLRWFPLEEAYRVVNQRSMTRQFDKIRLLQQNLPF